MYTLQCRETGHMGMMFILAVSNHHYGTYDSRQAQGPGTVPCETHTHTHARTPSMYTNTQKKTHIVAQMHTNSYLLHTHTEHTHTHSPGASGYVNCYATGIDVFWHSGGVV